MAGSFLVGTAAGPAGAESQVNTVTTGEQALSRVAGLAGGGSVVVYQSNENGDNDIFARRYDASWLPIGNPFQVNTYTTGSQAFPDVAQALDGSTIIVWDGAGANDDAGVFARVYDPTWVPLGDAFQVNSYTTSSQSSARAGVIGNRFTVAWTSFGQEGSSASATAARSRLGPGGGSDGVFKRDYDTAGNPLGGEVQVNTTTDGDQSAPTLSDDPLIQSVGLSFIVAFAGAFSPGGASRIVGPIPDTDVFGQLYDAEGNTLGGEFQINSHTTSMQSFPDIARGPDGSRVVVWDSEGQDGDGTGIFGQRHDPSGNALGGEFQVNTYTTSFQLFPTVATAPNGSSLVVWESFGQDGDGGGIFGQGYDAAGSPLGGEFQVNTYTTSFQNFPDVASQSDSSFVVSWDSFGQDGDGSGIFAEVVTLPEPSTWLGLLCSLPVLHTLSRRRMR